MKRAVPPYRTKRSCSGFNPGAEIASCRGHSRRNLEFVWRSFGGHPRSTISKPFANSLHKKSARHGTILAAIRVAVDRLGRHPGLGRAGRVEGTRELIISNAPYIVAYPVVENQVRILAIVHKSRQWPRRF